MSTTVQPLRGHVTFHSRESSQAASPRPAPLQGFRNDDIFDLAEALSAIERIRLRHQAPSPARLSRWLLNRQAIASLNLATRSLKFGLTHVIPLDGAPR